jgi:hypothetical protein
VKKETRESTGKGLVSSVFRSAYFLIHGFHTSKRPNSWIACGRQTLTGKGFETIAHAIHASTAKTPLPLALGLKARFRHRLDISAGDRPQNSTGVHQSASIRRPENTGEPLAAWAWAPFSCTA